MSTCHYFAPQILTWCLEPCPRVECRLGVFLSMLVLGIPILPQCETSFEILYALSLGRTPHLKIEGPMYLDENSRVRVGSLNLVIEFLTEGSTLTNWDPFEA